MTFFLALDQIQDPRNLGAILRSAEATGAHGAIVPKHNAAGVTAAAAKSAMGAVEYLPVARETNLDMWARWIAWLDTYVKNPKKK